MMILNWKIEQLDCVPSRDGLENIVQTVHWRLIGTIDQTTKSVCGIVSLGEPDPNNFIALSALTKEDVMLWVEAAIDKVAVESNLELEINEIISPTIVAVKPNFEE